MRQIQGGHYPEHWGSDLSASIAGITLTLQGTEVTVTPPPPGRVVSFTETSSNAFAGLIRAFCTAAYMRTLAGGEAA